jgi:replicative DNA helicase
MEKTEKNYDVYHRINIEIQVLASIIGADNKSGVKELVLKHNLTILDFHSFTHQFIFKAVLECYENGIIPTVVTICQFRPDKFRFNNAKTFEYEVIDILQKGINSHVLLEHHIMMLKQYVLFDFWNHKAYDVLYGNWNNRDVLQVGDNIISAYNKLYNRLTVNITTQQENDYETEIRNKVKNKSEGKSTGITTSVDAIDSFTGGYSLGELVIIAARPGMGKTTYALISAWNSAMEGNHVVFFSLEMARNQLKSKLIGLITGIEYKRIKKGELSNDELMKVIQADRYIEQSNLVIDDKIRTIEDIVRKSKEYVAKFNTKLFFLDYIQRTGSVDKMELRVLVTIITRELKSIAKELYVAFVALSQALSQSKQRYIFFVNLFIEYPNNFPIFAKQTNKNR